MDALAAAREAVVAFVAARADKPRDDVDKALTAFGMGAGAAAVAFTAARVAAKLAGIGNARQLAKLSDEHKQGPRCVLITGAGAGLGKASALALVQRGHTVVAADFDVDALLRLEADVAKSSAPGRIVPLPMNVADAASVRDAAKRLHRFAGYDAPTLDAIVNFAGVIRIGPLVELDDNALASILNINVLGTFLVNKYFFPLLRRHDRHRAARIVNVGSEVSYAAVTAGFNAPYSMTKLAVEAYTAGLRQELGFLPNPVHVTVLNPGACITDMADGTAAAFAKAADFPNSLFRSPILKGSKVAVSYINRWKKPASNVARTIVGLVEAPVPPRRALVNVSWEMTLAKWVPQIVMDYVVWMGVA